MVVPRVPHNTRSQGGYSGNGALNLKTEMGKQQQHFQQQQQQQQQHQHFCGYVHMSISKWQLKASAEFECTLTH